MVEKEDPNRYLTPRVNRRSQKRLRLHVSEADYQSVGRGRPWTAVVKDLDSDLVYVLRDAPCSSPECRCDAIVVARGREYKKVRRGTRFTCHYCGSRREDVQDDATYAAWEGLRYGGVAFLEDARALITDPICCLTTEEEA